MRTANGRVGITRCDFKISLLSTWDSLQRLFGLIRSITSEYKQNISHIIASLIVCDWSSDRRLWLRRSHAAVSCISSAGCRIERNIRKRWTFSFSLSLSHTQTERLGLCCPNNRSHLESCCVFRELVLSMDGRDRYLVITAAIKTSQGNYFRVRWRLLTRPAAMWLWRLTADPDRSEPPRLPTLTSYYTLQENVLWSETFQLKSTCPDGSTIEKLFPFSIIY